MRTFTVEKIGESWTVMNNGQVFSGPYDKQGALNAADRAECQLLADRAAELASAIEDVLEELEDAPVSDADAWIVAAQTSLRIALIRFHKK